MSDPVNGSPTSEVITSKNAILWLAIVTVFNFLGNIANLVITIISKKIDNHGEITTERIKKRNEELYTIYNKLKVLKDSIIYSSQTIIHIDEIKIIRSTVSRNEIIFTDQLSDILHDYLDYFTNISVDRSRIDIRKETQFEKSIKKQFKSMKI